MTEELDKLYRAGIARFRALRFTPNQEQPMEAPQSHAATHDTDPPAVQMTEHAPMGENPVPTECPYCGADYKGLAGGNDDHTATDQKAYEFGCGTMIAMDGASAARDQRCVQIATGPMLGFRDAECASCGREARVSAQTGKCIQCEPEAFSTTASEVANAMQEASDQDGEPTATELAEHHQAVDEARKARDSALMEASDEEVQDLLESTLDTMIQDINMRLRAGKSNYLRKVPPKLQEAKDAIIGRE